MAELFYCNLLKYYYKSAYSLCNSVKYENKMLFMAYLYEFKKQNPVFGRQKQVKTLWGKKIEYHSSFKKIDIPVNYNVDIENSHIEKKSYYNSYVNTYITNKEYLNNCNHNDYESMLSSIPMIRHIGGTTQLLQRSHIRFDDDDTTESDDMERDVDSVS